MIKVKKPEIKENKFNLENEEKPIVEALLKVSEAFHGGDEITQSVEDQRFALQASEEQNEENTKEQEEEIQEQGEQNEGQQEQSEQEEQNGKEENEETEENTQEENETENQEQEGTQNEEGQKEENTEEGENEEKEGQEEQEQNTEQAKGQEEADESGQGEQEEQNEEGQEENDSEEQGEQEENEETEQETEQTEEKQENSEQAFKLTGTKGQLFLKLYRLIEYLQEEEKALTPEPSQTQALNIKKLLFRQFERKPINSYYEYRERSQIIMLLDDSGSMKWLEEVLDTFFAVALKRKDVQVFIAPNGVIEDEYNEKTKKFQEIEHESAMKKIMQSRLPVIYIGDFDGANTPVELSWTNKIFWICTETRYKWFAQHDWVSYTEEQFKGFFGRAFNAEEILQVLQEFAKHIQQSYFWYDKHKEDEYDNEE